LLRLEEITAFQGCAIFGNKKIVIYTPQIKGKHSSKSYPGKSKHDYLGNKRIFPDGTSAR